MIWCSSFCQELHAAFIESHLLDQVRVVWPGQVLPVWVQNKICVFLSVGKSGEIPVYLAYNGGCHPAAIAEVIMLLPCNVVESLQLILKNSSTHALSSKELHWLDFRMELQDDSSSNGHQGDMPYSIRFCCKIFTLGKIQWKFYHTSPLIKYIKVPVKG